VAYELLSYRQAFRGTLEDGLLLRLPHEDPPALSTLCSGLPASLERLVMRALAKRPDDRFGNLEEFRVALREVRRSVDPDEKLESLAEPTLPRRPGSKPTPRPASTPSRRPDDADAGQLRDEAQQAQPLSEQGERELGDWERTVRVPVANADLELSKRDSAGAAPALNLDSANAATVPMGSRIQPKPRVISRGRMAAAIVVLAGTALGGGLWIVSVGKDEPSPTPAPLPAPPVARAEPTRTPVVPVAPRPDAEKPEVEVPPVVAPKPVLEPRPGGKKPTPPPVVPNAPIQPASGETPAPKPVSIEPPPSGPPVPTPTPVAVPEPPAPAPPPAAPPVKSPEAPPVVPTPSLLEQERPGILQALNRYQNAYRERSVKLLLSVYPSLPREDRQKLERAFRDCRDFDVTFGNMQMALDAEEPTLATVTVRSVYTCQPKTAQAAQPQAVQDVFAMRKLGDGWLIDTTGMMNDRRR
jgi:hypothetical protein